MKNYTNIKILVITYDFHPISTVASFRSLSWLKYFKEFGIEPIVLTHSKNFKKVDPNYLKDSMHVDKCGQVFYTHLENSFIDRHENSNNPFFVLIRKLYSFFSILFLFVLLFVYRSVCFCPSFRSIVYFCLWFRFLFIFTVYLFCLNFLSVVILSVYVSLF